MRTGQATIGRARYGARLTEEHRYAAILRKYGLLTSAVQPSPVGHDEQENSSRDCDPAVDPPIGSVQS